MKHLKLHILTLLLLLVIFKAYANDDDDDDSVLVNKIQLPEYVWNPNNEDYIVHELILSNEKKVKFDIGLIENDLSKKDPNSSFAVPSDILNKG
ncbi:MAG: hypothetical protein HRT66_11965 [Flavobacteriaceae bacterium]|nr:hypothetical protein [Flavobacteriaceae bacterium]